MGWIKAEVDETTHETLRREAADMDKPIHELAGELLRGTLQSSDAYIEVWGEQNHDD